MAGRELRRLSRNAARGTGWEKIQSVFSAVRNWGGNLATAYAAQGALALLLAASLAWLWHSDAAFELKAAALAAGSLLATPHVLDYDLVVLAVAIAFLARAAMRVSRFRDQPARRSLARAAVVALAGATGVPLGLIVLLALYGFTLRRAALDHVVANETQRIAQA